jgi:hypothetical protein
MAMSRTHPSVRDLIYMPYLHIMLWSAKQIIGVGAVVPMSDLIYWEDDGRAWKSQTSKLGWKLAPDFIANVKKRATQVALSCAHCKSRESSAVIASHNNMDLSS